MRFKYPRFRVLILAAAMLWIWTAQSLHAQIDNNGCVGANFGVDADFFSGILQFGNHNGAEPAGTLDWFTGPTGRGIINQTNPSEIAVPLSQPGNPTYLRRIDFGYSPIVDGQLWIDGLYSRDWFGGSGGIDQTAYVRSNKNAQNPALWSGGPTQVLGKNDIIDVGAFMMRDGATLFDDLWFFGTLVRAEPGGSAYMDFEFFVAPVAFTAGTGFSNGGPDLGHTAFLFDNLGRITRMGDIIFNVNMTAGGTVGTVQLRLWMSRTDFTNFRQTPPAQLPFTIENFFDGAYNGAPYGYAVITPKTASNTCGNVNLAGQNPPPPVWGHKGTKFNTLVSAMGNFAVMELGFNMTDYGVDPSLVVNGDPCSMPYRTVIAKTRSSESFTSELKDFAGPFQWGNPGITVPDVPPLSCFNLTQTLSATPARADVTYAWSTLDGRILTPTNLSSIEVDLPGTYTLNITLPTGCPIPPIQVVLGYNEQQPFYLETSALATVSCTGTSGTIDLTVTGTTPPFTYLWSDGLGTTQDLSGLAAGTYQVTVTDDIGCTRELEVTVPGPQGISATLNNANVSCAGGVNGAIFMTPTGKAPLSYLWSNGAISANITNQPAGTYTVTITDGDGCTDSFSETITQPALLTLALVAVDDSDPLPGSANANGSIDLTPAGGTPSYSYAWSGPGGFTATTQDIDNLERGFYQVSVTDANGCVAVIGAYIWEPEICDDGLDNDGDGLTDCDDPDCQPAPAPVIVPSLPEVCVGDNDAFYEVTQGPDYQWTTPEGSTFELDPPAGTHRILVDWLTTAGGQICVRIVTNGCLGPPSCLTVIPRDKPSTPDDIQVE